MHRGSSRLYADAQATPPQNAAHPPSSLNTRGDKANERSKGSSRRRFEARDLAAQSYVSMRTMRAAHFSESKTIAFTTRFEPCTSLILERKVCMSKAARLSAPCRSFASLSASASSHPEAFSSLT